MAHPQTIKIISLEEFINQAKQTDFEQVHDDDLGHGKCHGCEYFNSFDKHDVVCMTENFSDCPKVEVNESALEDEYETIIEKVTFQECAA